MTEQTIPSLLYKYRAFDSISLRLICESEAWYSRPSAFNDPLENLPELFNDISDTELLSLHDCILEGRGPERRRSFSVENDDEGNEFWIEPADYRWRVIHDVASYLTKRLDDCGVLTLSERWDSPLMWSHYADSHRGFCIGYDATDHRCKYIDRVRYDRDRGIRLSDVYGWKIGRSQESLIRLIDNAYFCKAGDWRYEAEWRDISAMVGVHAAPFEVSSIIFGMRCPSQVRTAIMLTYVGSGRRTLPTFYESSFEPMSFDMRLHKLDPSEFAQLRVSASMAFGSHQTTRELPLKVDE